MSTSDDLEPVGRPEYSPPRVAAGASMVGALFATVLLAGGSILAFGVAGAGVAALATGLSSGRRRLASVGSGLLFGALIVAAIEQVRPPIVLLAAVGAVVAHDGGQYAVTIGEQLGDEAETARAELVHVGATATVASATAGVGALTFRVGTGGQPTTALVAMLFAAVLLVWGLLR